MCGVWPHTSYANGLWIGGGPYTRRVAAQTGATRRRWGLVAGAVGAAVVIVGAVLWFNSGTSAVDGAVDPTFVERAEQASRAVEPLVTEPFEGADPARLPMAAAQRWTIELDGLVASDRTRLYVDGGETVLALLDQREADDDGDGVVVALDVETGVERWRASFDRGTGSLRILGVLEGVAMIERLHPDDRAIVGFDVESGAPRWESTVDTPGLNRVLDGTNIVTRIGVSDGAGLTFIDPVDGTEVGAVAGELFATDLLGGWFVRADGAVIELDLRNGWSPPIRVGELTDPERAVAAVVDGRLVEADGISLLLEPFGVGEDPVEVALRQLGPVATIRELLAMVDSTFVISTEATTYGAVLAGDDVELRWEVDGRVVNSIPTERGLALLIASAGGLDLAVVDASTGTTIAPVVREEDVLATLRIVGNGIVIERPAAIGVERVALDLDGQPLWSLIGSGPLAIGDELVTEFASTGDGVRITVYGTPSEAGASESGG